MAGKVEGIGKKMGKTGWWRGKGDKKIDRHCLESQPKKGGVGKGVILNVRDI